MFWKTFTFFRFPKHLMCSLSIRCAVVLAVGARIVFFVPFLPRVGKPVWRGKAIVLLSLLLFSLVVEGGADGSAEF